MNHALHQLDLTRQQASRAISPETKAALGQYMTPSCIASFMASLFDLEGAGEFHLLDAGAGIGSLSVAFFERLLAEKRDGAVDWVGYEIDPDLCVYLERHLQRCRLDFEARRVHFTAALRRVDFIEDSARRAWSRKGEVFNFAILNPPYKKIPGHSRHRLLLRQMQIETVNLYAAFVALAIDALADGGQLVAILPRSFCNGPYYRPFRQHLLAKTAIRRIHLFDARDKAFGDEEVLQENLVIHLERGGAQGAVRVSTSTDGYLHDYAEAVYAFDQIVLPDNPEGFIHIPTSHIANPLDTSTSFRYTLGDLGLEVSTGPVVDFRLKAHLRAAPAEDTAPLLYPGHFGERGVEWPRLDGKKPNALALNSQTERWLYPNGFYTIVRRFSSKEERRRIRAYVIDPLIFPTAWIGLENHLNVFHVHKQGLSADLAHGLAVYLNSTSVDQYFRRFSGHTQVNATDLRLLKYPSLEVLARLGEWARGQVELTQEIIDGELAKYV